MSYLRATFIFNMKTETDKSARCYAKMQLFINAPVAHVYDTLVDLNSWPRWMQRVSAMTVHGPIGDETEFVWKASGQTIYSRMHTLQHPGEIGWTGRVLWIRAVHNWRFVAEDKGTLVTVDEHFKGLGASFMKNAMEKGMRDALEALKLTCEK
jgi:hypothetical protein